MLLGVFLVVCTLPTISGNPFLAASALSTAMSCLSGMLTTMTIHPSLISMLLVVGRHLMPSSTLVPLLCAGKSYLFVLLGVLCYSFCYSMGVDQNYSPSF